MWLALLGTVAVAGGVLAFLRPVCKKRKWLADLACCAPAVAGKFFIPSIKSTPF